MPAPVTPRASRLLLDLAAAIEATRDVHEADCLRADLAAQLVRGGHDAEGEAMLVDLRTRYRTTPHERVTPWLNFAEATIDMKNGRGPEALIKMRRAHALSQASALPLTALAAASLASMYWNLEDADKAVGHASEALRIAHEGDHRAIGRASLVVGEILGMSRRHLEAPKWYARARMHAAIVGDNVALSAVGFNLAATRLATARQHALLHGPGEMHSASTQVEASQNLDKLLMLPMDDFSRLQTAQIYLLSSRPVDATALLLQLLNEAKVSSATRQRPRWLSELAWCYATSSQLEKARETAELVESSPLDDVQLDDRAATHSRLAHVFELLGEHDRARVHAEAAAPLWAQYEAFQDHCAHLVDTLVPPLPP